MLAEQRLADTSATGHPPGRIAVASRGPCARPARARDAAASRTRRRPLARGRPTYADIPVPRGPAELSERLTELERQLWRLATGRVPGRSDPALRRTYGFFDAAEHLGERVFGLVA